MIMRKNSNRPMNESGLVAIVVSMVIILVLSLIVLAFAKISQREQRQALDRQLNAQAFYAAEAGINDAREALKKGEQSLLSEDGNNCTPNLGGSFSRDLDGSNVRYTCLLIDATPRSIEFNSISSGETKISPIQAKDGGSIGQLSIYWEDANNGRNFTGCPSSANDALPTDWNASCDPGIIRFDLVPFDVGTNRNDLINNTATVFAIPTNGGGPGTVSYSSVKGFGNQGAKIAVGCKQDTTPNYPRNCKLDINGLNANRYYIRLTSIYKSSAVSLCFPDCGSSARETIKTQALIDSTGRANDVLKRIQVRVALKDLFQNDLYGPFPGYAIESGNEICKTFSIGPTEPPQPTPTLGATCAVSY